MAANNQNQNVGGNKTKTYQNQQAFGMKYTPRSQLPSMFEILSWDYNVEDNKNTHGHKTEEEINHSLTSKSPEHDHYKTFYVQQYPNERLEGDQQKVVEQIKQNKTIRTKSHGHVIKNQLYIEQPPIQYERRSKQSPSSQNLKKKKKRQSLIAASSKPKLQKKEKKKLDEKKDKDVIKRRQQRIKQFNIQSRNLPNSAFVTYYGKPAFQNYGRNNTKSTAGGILYGQYLHTHNVMPHKGSNNPQNIETYKTALMNAEKYNKKTLELPRKKDSNYVHDQKKSQTHSNNSPEKNVYHIEIPKPDLINANRFASEPSTPQKSKQKNIIPRPVTAKIQKQNIPKVVQPKKTKPVGKKIQNNSGQKPNQQGQQRRTPPHRQQLKFMNNRDNFIDQMNQKKMKNTRLAYKVTECYPVVPQNRKVVKNPAEQISDPKDYKNIDTKWKTLIPAAGKLSAPHMDIKQLFVFKK